MNWQFLPQVSGACEAVSGTETERTHPNTPEKPESLKPPCSAVRVLEISLMAVLSEEKRFERIGVKS